jgi:hypothetical protein
MTAALLIAIVYVAILWLVFFRLKLLKFSIGWGVASFWVGLHLVLAFVLGLRYVTPNSSNATVVQHTIQTHTTPPRADPGYGSDGRRGYFREEGTTFVSVRSPSL